MKRAFVSALLAAVVAACGDEKPVTAPSAPSKVRVLAAVGMDSTTGATIETDLDDYAPGGFVYLTGRGWAPNETVHFVMTEDPDVHEDVMADVEADSTGAFSLRFYEVQEADLGVAFTLTATGTTSGSAAVVSFTDGSISNGSVTMRDGATCTAPQGSVAAGTPICAHSSFTVSGGGATKAQIRWRSPANAIVQISQRSPDFPNGTSGTQTFDATFTPTVTGTWTVLLCEGENTDLSPGGDPGCQSGMQRATQTFTVSAASVATTTGVVSNANPSVTGQGVTFTATVTAGTNSVTSGSVTFKLGGANCADAVATAIGSAVAVNGTTGKATSASQTLNATQTGAVVRACYGGAPGFNTSEGSVTQTVNKAETETSLSDTPAASSVGQTVTFTATVTAKSPGAGTPAGTVTLYELTAEQTCDALGGAVALGSGAVGAGIAVNSLTAGNHTITACYAGDANFKPSSGTDTHSVSLVVTTTEIAPNFNPSVTGQVVTFTATVKANGNPIGAQGNVVFKIGGANCSDATTLATQALNGSGQAQTTRAFLPSEGSPKAVRACYQGNSSYATSEGSVSQVVNPATTTTALVASPNPSTYGQTVTFTATVTVQSPGVGAPTGTVSFYVFDPGGSCSSPNGKLLYGKTLSSGSASVMYNKLTAGSHAVTACYAGNADFVGSTDGTSQTVDKATLTITASGGTKVFGTTLAVTPSYSGFVLSESPSVLTTLPTCSSNGSAANAPVSGSPYTTTCSAAAADNYKFSYVNGTMTVTPAPTTLTLAAPVSTQYSDKIKLSASVSPATLEGSDQSGTVEFFIAGTSVGKVTLVNGSATKVDIPNAYGAANYNVTAEFKSSNQNFGNDADGPKMLTITQEDASITPDAANLSSINVSQTTFQLKFSVKETNPEPEPSPDPDSRAAPGDITKANFAAKITGITSNAQYTGQCSGVPTGSPPSYAAAKIFTCTFSTSSFTVDAYTVDVTVGGYYYVGSDEDALTVFDPAAGFVTGGGKLLLAGGDRVSFGLSFTYIKGKTTGRGGIVIVRHHPDGSSCRVKSNSMDAPAVNGTTASLTGKGNYTCVDSDGATTASQGNLSILGYVEDNGTSGAGQDKFWVRAYGELLMAMPPVSSAVVLTGGNIQVPQPSSK